MRQETMLLLGSLLLYSTTNAEAYRDFKKGLDSEGYYKTEKNEEGSEIYENGEYRFACNQKIGEASPKTGFSFEFTITGSKLSE